MANDQQTPHKNKLGITLGQVAIDGRLRDAWIFSRSRGKQVLGILGASLFVLAAVAMYSDAANVELPGGHASPPLTRAVAIVTGVVFAGMIVVGVRNLGRPLSYVALIPRGFFSSGVTPPVFVDWEEIEQAGSYTSNHVPMLGLRFADPVRIPSLASHLKRINASRAWSGWDWTFGLNAFAARAHVVAIAFQYYLLHPTARIHIGTESGLTELEQLVRQKWQAPVEANQPPAPGEIPRYAERLHIASRENATQEPLTWPESLAGLLPRHGISGDSVPTHEHIVRLIGDLGAPISPAAVFQQQGVSIIHVSGASQEGMWGPFASWEEAEMYREVWVSQAPPEALDAVIEVLLHPPTTEAAGPPGEEWFHDCSTLLGEWGRQRPQSWIEKIGPLLANSAVRRYILDAMVEAGTPAAVPYLVPLISQYAHLSHADKQSLFDALGELHTPESEQALLELRERLDHDDPQVSTLP